MQLICGAIKNESMWNQHIRYSLPYLPTRILKYLLYRILPIFYKSKT